MFCVCPCPCVSVCVCEEDVYEKREERKSKKKKEKKEKWNKKKKRKEITKKRENYKLIHADKQTDTQTDRWMDRHKSFIDMRYYTEQYSKSNSITENRTKSNRIDLK